MIYAVKMHEYNKGDGHLRRRWMSGKWNKQFTAGDATPKRRFIPSPIVEVTEEEFEYLTGKDENGFPYVAQPRNPSLHVFQGFKFETRRDLVAMAQSDADKRASRGSSTARAMTNLLGPLEPIQQVVKPKPVEKEEPKAEFKPIDVQEELEGKESVEDEPKDESDPPKRRGRRSRRKSGDE